ncbi:MAG: hypothetical protein ACM3ZC_08425 [Bacteroidota bacterium]
MQKEIENPLGRLILEGKIRDGQEVVVEKGARGLEFKAGEIEMAVR